MNLLLLEDERLPNGGYTRISRSIAIDVDIPAPAVGNKISYFGKTFEIVEFNSLSVWVKYLKEAPIYQIEGQSNGDGRGLYEDLPSEFKGKRQEDVFIWKVARHFFAPMVPGKNTSIANLMFGVEVRLGKMLKEYKNEPVYFVKYSPGGTAVAALPETEQVHWDWNYSSVGENYDVSTHAMSGARTELDKKWANPQIKCLIWIQGGRDGTRAEWASKYEENLRKHIENKRKDYNQPELKIVILLENIALMDVNPPFTHIPEIRAAQTRIAESDPNIYLINVDDLPVGHDKVHFDAAVLLGGFAERIFSVIKDF